MHYALHLQRQIARDNNLVVDCFSLERKHRVPKAFGGNSKNLKDFDRYTLSHVISDQLRKVSEDPACLQATRLQGRRFKSVEMALMMGVQEATVCKACTLV